MERRDCPGRKLAAGFAQVFFRSMVASCRASNTITDDKCLQLPIAATRLIGKYLCPGSCSPYWRHLYQATVEAVANEGGIPMSHPLRSVAKPPIECGHSPCKFCHDHEHGPAKHQIKRLGTKHRKASKAKAKAKAAASASADAARSAASPQAFDEEICDEDLEALLFTY